MNNTIEIKENYDRAGNSLHTWNLYNAGRFGDVYELDLRALEVLLVTLGDKINEIKSGINDMVEGVD